MQADYIRTVLDLMARPENSDFRWNCETLFCVEEFFKSAAPDRQEDFCRLAAEGKIGLSANYLNFNDLVDCQVYSERLARWQARLGPWGAAMKTAMTADINGISMGYRDALLENGVEFLFANIHCHHGMYPLYQNQTAFFWENAAGQRLLVWNGEHYNLGNVLGIRPNQNANFMIRDRLGEQSLSQQDPVEALHRNLSDYLGSCESQGYPYDFILTAVSGVFSDNAPPEPEILRTIRAFNTKYGGEVRLRMVSLQELYAAIGPRLADAPVYRGGPDRLVGQRRGQHALRREALPGRPAALSALPPPGRGRSREVPGALHRRPGQFAALRRAHLGPLLHHHQPL